MNQEKEINGKDLAEAIKELIRLASDKVKNDNGKQK